MQNTRATRPTLRSTSFARAAIVAALPGALASMLALAGCDRGGDEPAEPRASGVVGSDAGDPTGDGVADPTVPEVTLEEQPWRTAATRPGTYHVRWRPLTQIESLEPFDVEVEVFDDEEMTIPATRIDALRVDAGMPHHRHGMNVEPEIESAGDGRWIARGMLMHMLGRWEVTVDVARDGELERAQWTVTLK